MSANLTTLKAEISKNSHHNINKAVAARVLYEAKGGQDKTILSTKIIKGLNAYVYTRVLLKSVYIVEKAKKEVIIGHWTAENYTRDLAVFLDILLKKVYPYRKIKVEYVLTDCQLGNITNHTSIFITYEDTKFEIPFKFGKQADKISQGLQDATEFLLFMLMTNVGVDIEKPLTMLEMREIDGYVGKLL